MCNGRFFHKWGKWNVVESTKFKNTERGSVKVVCIQERICAICHKTQINLSASQI